MGGSKLFSENDWRSYSQGELNAQYDQSSAVPNVQEYLDRWEHKSELVRHQMSYKTFRYGVESCETFDLYSGVTGTIHLHIHGGAWRSLSKRQVACVVPGLGATGDAVAVLDFGLAPAFRMGTIVAQVQRAFRYVLQNWPDCRIIVSGHSSGAHLASCLLADIKNRLAPEELARIDGVFLASGPYDLRPVQASARNSYLSLSSFEAAAYTALGKILPDCPPVSVFFGEFELDEFRRQAHCLVQALEAARVAVQKIELRGLNHFDIYDLFCEPFSAVTDVLR